MENFKHNININKNNFNCTSKKRKADDAYNQKENNENLDQHNKIPIKNHIKIKTKNNINNSSEDCCNTNTDLNSNDPETNKFLQLIFAYDFFKNSVQAGQYNSSFMHRFIREENLSKKKSKISSFLFNSLNEKFGKLKRPRIIRLKDRHIFKKDLIFLKNKIKYSNIIYNELLDIKNTQNNTSEKIENLINLYLIEENKQIFKKNSPIFAHINYGYNRENVLSSNYYNKSYSNTIDDNIFSYRQNKKNTLKSLSKENSFAFNEKLKNNQNIFDNNFEKQNDIQNSSNLRNTINNNLSGYLNTEEELLENNSLFFHNKKNFDLEENENLQKPLTNTFKNNSNIYDYFSFRMKNNNNISNNNSSILNDSKLNNTNMPNVINSANNSMSANFNHYKKSNLNLNSNRTNLNNNYNLNKLYSSKSDFFTNKSSKNAIDKNNCTEINSNTNLESFSSNIKQKENHRKINETFSNSNNNMKKKLSLNNPNLSENFDVVHDEKKSFSPERPFNNKMFDNSDSFKFNSDFNNLKSTNVNLNSKNNSSSTNNNTNNLTSTNQNYMALSCNGATNKIFELTSNPFNFKLDNSLRNNSSNNKNNTNADQNNNIINNEKIGFLSLNTACGGSGAELNNFNFTPNNTNSNDKTLRRFKLSGFDEFSLNNNTNINNITNDIGENVKKNERLNIELKENINTNLIRNQENINKYNVPDEATDNNPEIDIDYFKKHNKDQKMKLEDLDINSPKNIIINKIKQNDSPVKNHQKINKTNNNSNFESPINKNKSLSHDCLGGILNKINNKNDESNNNSVNNLNIEKYRRVNLEYNYIKKNLEKTNEESINAKDEDISSLTCSEYDATEKKENLNNLDNSLIDTTNNEHNINNNQNIISGRKSEDKSLLSGSEVTYDNFSQNSAKFLLDSKGIF